MPIIASPKTINLALQGGGSHGAFTWGVLDRLLEEDNLTIEGISGTSAGAMNGAALLQGHCKGGKKGAKESLENFWYGVGKLSSFDISPLSTPANAWQRMFPPYQTNGLKINPLRDLLTKMLDIETIRACDAIKLFICATNVENGRAHIFERKDLTIDVLMASACLPFIFQAVNIGGTPYWDGGYSGNPAIFPLIYNCESPDVVLVHINPLTRRGAPETPTEIINRLNEITFNAAIIGEMHAIALVQRLIEEDHLKNSEAARLKNLKMHVISGEDQMRSLGASSQLNASMDFLLHLKEIGRKATGAWLMQNWQMIGEGSSVDIRRMFLD